MFLDYLLNETKHNVHIQCHWSCIKEDKIQCLKLTFQEVPQNKDFGILKGDLI